MNTRFLAVFAAVSLLLNRADAQTVLHDAPGTPVAGFTNPGGSTVVIAEGGGMGVQTVPAPSADASPALSFSALPGDVVFLLDPAAGDAPSNWAAVLDFFNPGDPTGMLGLDATRYQTYRANSVLGGFASLTLPGNTVYVPVASISPDGTAMASYEEYGPDGQILSGQLAIFLLTASPQPDAVPEPGTLGCLGTGAALLGFAFRNRRKRSEQP